MTYSRKNINQLLPDLLIWEIISDSDVIQFGIIPDSPALDIVSELAGKFESMLVCPGLETLITINR